MINPFRIIWELIEFGIQALFIYGLAIILCVGLIAYVIADKKEPEVQIQYIYPKDKVEEVKECQRISGCRILEDGTIEW
tara:strand:+ start:428 stop:664 length:237 start_codon:yes stop_codon:yes gene_type:complete